MAFDHVHDFDVSPSGGRRSYSCRINRDIEQAAMTRRPSRIGARAICRHFRRSLASKPLSHGTTTTAIRDVSAIAVEVFASGRRIAETRHQALLRSRSRASSAAEMLASTSSSCSCRRARSICATSHAATPASPTCSSGLNPAFAFAIASMPSSDAIRIFLRVEGPARDTLQQFFQSLVHGTDLPRRPASPRARYFRPAAALGGSSSPASSASAVSKSFASRKLR